MRMSAEPHGATARRYIVASDGALIGEIRFPLLGPSTATPIGGRVYRLWRAGVLRESFTLMGDGAPVAHAVQRDPLRREFAVDLGERRLTLRADSLLRSGYQLLEDDRVVGSLRPAELLRHGMVADLPDDLPLVGRIFLVWVVLLLWRRLRVTRAGAHL